MTVIYDTDTKTDRMEATREKVASGTLQIRDASNNVLVTYDLDATAGSVSGATWTLGFDATTVAATGTGNAANARILDSGATARVTGLTVGLSGSGADVIIDEVAIVAAEDITCLGAAITHAA